MAHSARRAGQWSKHQARVTYYTYTHTCGLLIVAVRDVQQRRFQSGRTRNIADWPNVDTARKNRNRKKSFQVNSKKLQNIGVSNIYTRGIYIYMQAFSPGASTKPPKLQKKCKQHVILRTGENLVPANTHPRLGGRFPGGAPFNRRWRVDVSHQTVVCLVYVTMTVGLLASSAGKTKQKAIDGKASDSVEPILSKLIPCRQDENYDMVPSTRKHIMTQQLIILLQSFKT